MRVLLIREVGHAVFDGILLARAKKCMVTLGATGMPDEKIGGHLPTKDSIPGQNPVSGDAEVQRNKPAKGARALADSHGSSW
jgi:hypothetical protein